MPRRLAPVLAAVAACLAVAPAARAEVRRLSYRVGPIEVAPYQVCRNGVDHDIPNGFTSEKKLGVPGSYRLLCSLHPVAMTERIVVRR